MRMTLIATPAMTSALAPGMAPLLLQLLEQAHGTSLIPQLNLLILLLSTPAISSALWQATLGASSYNSLLLSLGIHSSLDPWPSPVAAGYPCLCNQLVKEERILQITLPLCWAPQGGRPGDLLKK